MPVAWPGWVTLYTDANPSGWGAYARAWEGLATVRPWAGPRVEAWGAFVEGELDTTLAELRAIAEGVACVLAHWVRVDGIGVRTDSQAAIRVLEGRGPARRRPDLSRVVTELRHRLGPVRLRLSWVRGHLDPDSGAQAWLNNRADRLAARARAGPGRP